MKALDPLRVVLRLLAWAVALGLLAAVVHALVMIEALPILRRSSPLLAQVGSTGLLLVITFAVVWLGSRVVQLPRAAGAAAGAFAGLLPVVIGLAIEGPSAVGPPKVIALRAVVTVLAALAGALPARK